MLYLGGPLTFLPQLKKSFDKTLGVTGTCPENSLYFVALGAALYSDKELDLAGVVEKLHAYSAHRPPMRSTRRCSGTKRNTRRSAHGMQRRACRAVPLRTAPALCIRHRRGSTTVKAAVIDGDDNLLFTSYQPNSGNPSPSSGRCSSTFTRRARACGWPASQPRATARTL